MTNTGSATRNSWKGYPRETIVVYIRECSFEKCWGGGGGGVSEFRTGFRGGHVNFACVEKSQRRYIFK